MCDIAKMAAIAKKFGGTGAGGTPVQPDWNQNDPTAADYVKGRTHWVEKRTAVADMLVKVSSDIPNDLSGDATITASNGNVVQITCTPVSDSIVGCLSDMPVFIVLVDGTDFNGYVFPEKGIYFPKNERGYISRFELGDYVVGWDGEFETVHTIDPKFLPSGSGGAFVVTINETVDENGESTFAATKTAAEIYAATKSGIAIYGVVEFEGEYSPCMLYRATETVVEFVTPFADDGCMKYVFLPTGVIVAEHVER